MKPIWAPAALLLLAVGGLGVLAKAPEDTTLGTYSTPLSGRSGSQRHNAVRVLEEIQGTWIAPGETFSFNRRVRGWTRDMGYKQAPVSYNGQLVSSWGGGVCQTSTTLYNAALLAGLDVVERHRHRFAPSYVPPGRDAAVAFENIDLKLRNPHPFPVRILGEVKGERLSLRIVGKGKGRLPLRVVEEIREVREPLRFQVRGEERRVRNSGKNGYEVVVWRVWEDRREMISEDDYPAMNRIVEVQ